jgi:hypothetical protein
MPYEICFDNHPTGHALGYCKDGEKVQVKAIEFTSSEDGQHFVQRLEGFPDEILRKTDSPLSLTPSGIDHLLAIIRPDKSATVYINELVLKSSIRIGRTCEVGEAIYKDDIVDFEELDWGDIPIPIDCGVVFLFSIGWRKGLFYDFSPLPPMSQSRNHNCKQLFGQFFSQVFFQERFRISETVWEKLFEGKWFPFSALKNSTIEQLINSCNAGWNLDDLTDPIVSEVKGKLDLFLHAWDSHPNFVPHMPLIHKAFDHFRADDFVSCTAVLYPRIEGILRTNHKTTKQWLKTQHLTSSAIESKKNRFRSLLLPQKFEQYLNEVYFAGFDPTDPKIDVTRHSVSHGTASVENFNAKSAAIGILILSHLFYCFEPASQNESEKLTVMEVGNGLANT